MIIWEGTPGAGKTTALGAALAAHPDALIFPEAQPPAAAQHPVDVDALLAEDRHRVELAADVAVRLPGIVVASDRCHLGVLAYRYALASTGRTAHEVFDGALDRARQLDLDGLHHLDEVSIVLIDPELSRRRRARHADDPRYRLWFDVDFIDAFNRFLLDLDRWVAPGPRWRTRTTAGAGPDTAPSTGGPDLLCARRCRTCRSPLVRAGTIAVQLYAGAVHHRPSECAPVACLRAAGEVAAAWRDRVHALRGAT